MKIRLLIILSLALSYSFAGGFRFPNQPYSYAKLFLFNTHYEKGRPDQHIYKNGIYAQSKVGNGYAINKDVISKMNSIFKQGVDEIWSGLSKCSTPRHGIIFYNSKHQPIASISICFECERVNFWSSLAIHSTLDYDKYDIDKAEKQMKDLKALFKANNMHVFDDKKEYKTYVDNNPNYKNEGTMNMKNTELDSTFGKKITMTEIKSWIKGPLRFQRDTVEKMTMSDSYYFYEYNSKTKNDDTKFIVSGTEEDSYLIQAEIYNPYIVLPNSVQIGMSLDDVISTFQVYDGIAFPETITVSGEKYKLEYNFKNQTLVKIKLYIWPN